MKVLIFPKDPNPYQELLYSQLRLKIKIKYLANPTKSYALGLILLFPQLLIYRLKGFDIFHLHWVYNFKSPINNILFKTIVTIYFLLFLSIIKLLRYKLIWTVHNVLPHDKQFVNDVLARRFLSKLCDAKIVHSESTIDEMKKIKMDTKNVYIIPHGNYIESYENKVNERDAKKYFDYKIDDFVFLFFGRIEKYKGIEDLLEVFKKITKKRKNIKLLIAGKCQDENLKKLLNNYKNKLRNNIKICTKFIENNEVQYYFNCANAIVYPFKEITTSGSVILALSFGKPVICPRIGALKDMPDNLGYFYNERDEKGLYNCMLKAIENKKDLQSWRKRI
ncbi:glycosyltransferase [Candidatus Microgenomates bacterium]|nr:MAG: glycosyltransferase [Candidatus Microgenomates bacterium]